MNKYFTHLLALIPLMLAGDLMAQQVQRCHTTEVLDRMTQNDPQLQQRIDAFDTQMRDFLQNNKSKTRSSAVITIPVVVHVIHNGEDIGNGTNISEEQVISQIDALNLDYRMMNTDINQVPSHFTGVIGDVEVEFCLAVTDPNGQPTDGIDRIDGGQSEWQDNDFDSQIKPTTYWNPNNYLNIWTANFGSQSTILGYATFPGQSQTQDGVVIDFRYFGVSPQNPFSSEYDLGRTATHEIGHWLGLLHTFQGSCQGTSAANCATAGDRICDTPPTQSANYGCSSLSPNQNSCTETPTDQNDMWMNYMDYANDACLIMFTQDQAAVMQATLQTTRSGLQNSTACTPKNYISNSGKVIDAINSAPVPDAKVVLIGDNGATFELTTDANGNYSIATFVEGTYEIYAGKWGYGTNQYSQGQYLDANTGAITIPITPHIYYDDFLMDFGWTSTSNASSGDWVRGIPNGTDWQGAPSNPGNDVTTDYGDNCYVTGNGGGNAGSDDVDNGTVTLTSPKFDLTGYVAPVLSYDRWFYNAGGQGTPNDELVIKVTNGNSTFELERISGDTENKWTSFSVKVAQKIFPTTDMQLIIETSDLQGSGNICEAALDNFKVVDNFPLAVKPNTFAARSFSIFPNPTNGITTIQFELAQAADYTVSIKSINGQQLAQLQNGNAPKGAKQTINLDTKAYPPGIYLIQLEQGGQSHYQKLVVME